MADAPNTPKFLSPRLQQLNDALHNGESTALAAFWQEIKAKGTPLVEPVEGDDDHILATFLHEANGDIDNVILFSAFTHLKMRQPSDYCMTRLGETNLWYRTEKLRADVRTTYNIPVNDPLKKPDELSEDERKAQFKLLLTSYDPFNSERFAVLRDPDDPEDFDVTMSVFVGPKAKPQRHIAEREGVKRGSVEQFKLKSAILENERKLWVYTPPDYDANTHQPYTFLLVFDGSVYKDSVPTPTLLDNLLAEGAIPPMVCVMLDNASGEARGKELPPNEKFPAFIQDELMPWIRERYTITDNPAQSYIGGSSYGGLAATWNAFKCPHLFGNVISQSGSFWWFPKTTNPESTDDEPGWLIRQFAASERLPLKFYMDVGLLECSDSWQGSSHRSLNRHMRDVLRAKGYPVTYVEYSGGHDYIWWRQTLADGLMALSGM